MAKPLRVKATLQYPQGLELGTSPLIRRFKVNRNGAPSGGEDLYRRLVATLPTVFPELKYDCSLYWKDEDDDLVQFSTAEELQAAVDHTSDNVLRIYIVVDPDTSQGETTDTDEEHGKTREDQKEDKRQKSSKRVQFYKAGKRWRRRLRRRRKAALTDDETVSKEYRLAVRQLIKHVHKSQGKNAGATDKPLTPEQQAAISSLTPEVQAFVRKVVDEWHGKLADKRPRVVARKIRREKRTFPQGLQQEHFRWLCRSLARWHRRHAGKCDVMSGWSSGETGDDSSDDEETLLRQHRSSKKRSKKTRQATRETTQATQDSSECSDSEETSDDKVSKQFRKDARALLSELHRKKVMAATPAQKATASTLTPEVQAFIRKLAEDWHTLLATKRPKVVARKFKKEKRELPAGMQEDHFRWLCRSLARWHRRHAGKCDVMSGWSSGESGGESTDDEKKVERKGSEVTAKQQSAQGLAPGEEDDRISKEFRKAVRVLVKQIHGMGKGGEKKGKPPSVQEQANLAALSPEAQHFVEQLAQQWHKKLARKRPAAVARKIRRGRPTLPTGLEKDHFRYLCRYLARWHRKHADKCDAMSAWSSGESGDDSSGDEEAARQVFPEFSSVADALEIEESEATDCLESPCKPVSKEFRSDIHHFINLLHKDTTDVAKKAPSTLTPDVQGFLKTFSETWHSKLSALGKPRPRAVSKEMKSSDVTLPSRLEREQYVWLCCYMARWHRKHAGKCDAMASPQ